MGDSIFPGQSAPGPRGGQYGVLPGGLEDGPRTGVARCITDARETVGRPRIARADVADFMLKALPDDRFVRQAVGLTY